MSSFYHQSRTPELYGSTITLTIVATVAVVLRFASRRISSAPYWWDDWAIIIALIFAYGLYSCYWLMTRNYGLGHHSAQVGGPVDENTEVGFFKVFLAIQILYFSTAVSFKTSLVLLYHRIFGVVRWYRWVLAFAESIVACYFIVCLFTAIFECKPVSYYWDKSNPHGKCINQTAFYRWNGVANMLIDLFILCLTFPMVWRLKIGTRQKITLSGIFLLGTFVFVASVVRVTVFGQLKPKDEPYTNVEPAIWTVVEQGLGITCACLPTLRPLFGRLLFGPSHNVGSSGTTRSGDIHLSKRSYRPSITRPEDEEAMIAGLGALPVENMPTGGIVTTHATATNSEDPRTVPPEAIVKSQSIEQHFSPPPPISKFSSRAQISP